MLSSVHPRGYTPSGFVAVVNGRRMEFVTYDEYREYIQDDPPMNQEAA